MKKKLFALLLATALLAGCTVGGTGKKKKKSSEIIDPDAEITSVTIYDGDTPAQDKYTFDLYISSQKTKQFSAKVEKIGQTSEEVLWTSSDETKVSVSKTGLVTCLKETVNDVVVTATSKIDQTKSDTVSIRVNNTTPKVKNVTVNLSNSTVRLGKSVTATYSIDAEIDPSLKTAVWSSSNTSIATISSDGTITPKAVGKTNIIATATYKNPDDTYSQGSATLEVLEAKDENAYTIMIYMCGADLESSNTSMNPGGAASEDIKEIVDAGKAPEGVNIVLQTGGANSWKSVSSSYTSDGQKIPTSNTRWFLNGSAKFEKVASTYQPSDTSMGLESTFTSFLSWGLTNYPAEKTAVILWNHGGGMSGCCFDERNDDDGLTPSELYSSFKSVLGNPGSATKLEWIGYDCCTMQMADIASINADYFHYQVASQELEASTGWVYTDWLTKLYNSIKNKTQLATGDLLKEICDDFVSANEIYGSDNDQVLSYIKLDYMPAFTNAFNAFVSSYTTPSDYDTIVNAAESSLRFSEYDGACFGDVDMRHLLLQLGAATNSEVITAYDNIIGYHKYDSGASVYSSKKPTGLNAFVAFEPSYDLAIQIEKDDYNCSSSVYSTKFESWCNLMRSYGTFASSFWY